MPYVTIKYDLQPAISRSLEDAECDALTYDEDRKLSRRVLAECHGAVSDSRVAFESSAEFHTEIYRDDLSGREFDVSVRSSRSEHPDEVERCRDAICERMSEISSNIPDWIDEVMAARASRAPHQQDRV